MSLYPLREFVEHKKVMEDKGFKIEISQSMIAVSINDETGVVTFRTFESVEEFNIFAELLAELLNPEGKLLAWIQRMKGECWHG